MKGDEKTMHALTEILSVLKENNRILKEQSILCRSIDDRLRRIAINTANMR